MLGTDAAINEVASNGGVSASAAAGSAVSVERGQDQRTAKAARVAMPAERRAAGMAGPSASNQMSPDGQSPPAASSRSQRSGELPEASQMSAHAGAVKAEPVGAATGPVPADACPEVAALARPVEVLDGAGAPHHSVGEMRRKDEQPPLPRPQFGHAGPATASGSPGNSGASAAAVGAGTAVGRSPSLPQRPEACAASNGHMDAQPDQRASRLPDVPTPRPQLLSASQQPGLQEGSPDASPQPGKGPAAMDQVAAIPTILQPTTTVLPAEQAGVQRVGNPSSGAQPEQSGLPPAELALMRQLVAQLANSQPPAAQQSLPQPQQLPGPAQAALAEVANVSEPTLAPIAAQQPGMPVDPRPARMHALARAQPRRAEQEPEAGAATARPSRVQAGMQPAHTFSATRPLAGPHPQPGGLLVEASAALSAGEARKLQQDKPKSTSPAAADVPSGEGRGVMPHEDVGVPGLEPSPEDDAPRSEGLPNTTRIYRIPTNVRLPNPGVYGWARPRDSPTAEGGFSGVSPSATAASSVPAPEAGLSPSAKSASAAGLALIAVPAPAADLVAHAQAASASDTALEAWLRELPAAVRKDLESVRELVLPLKKLRLLADIDAHLYKFSKSACWQLRGSAGRASPPGAHQISSPANPDLLLQAACIKQFQLLHVVLCAESCRHELTLIACRAARPHIGDGGCATCGIRREGGHAAH